MRHVERGRGAWQVDPRGVTRRRASRDHNCASRSQEVRRRRKSRYDGVANVRDGGVSGGLELGPLELLSLFLVSVLVATEGL